MAETQTVMAVDIGTNSVKMTIARRGADGRPEVLADRTEITRLGKKVDADGRLLDEAVERTLAALKNFAEEATSFDTGRIAAVGTSALRDAANGPEFVTRAEEILGGKVEIIAGEREAELIYQAASRDPDLPLPKDAETLLATMDIGGGSTEVVLGRGGKVLFRDSLQLGAVRVTERALPSDPPTEPEITAATQLVDEILTKVPLPEPSGQATIVVGSGGTAANLASMERCAGLPEGSPRPSLEELHAAKVTLAQIDARIRDLAARLLAERRITPGLEPDRADVIIAGAIIQAQALRRLGAQEVIVSLRGLRYGLLYEMLG